MYLRISGQNNEKDLKCVIGRMYSQLNSASLLLKITCLGFICKSGIHNLIFGILIPLVGIFKGKLYLFLMK